MWNIFERVQLQHGLLDDLRVSQIEDVDDWVLLNDEMGEKEESDQNEESRQTSKNQNKTFSPEKYLMKLDFEAWLYIIYDILQGLTKYRLTFQLTSKH